MPKLNRQEEKKRSQAYKGLDSKQKLQLKKQFDAARSEDPTMTRLRKYQLKPNQAQRRVLLTWMRDCHRTYNWCLRYIRDHKLHHFKPGMAEPKWAKLKEELRTRYVYATAFRDTPKRQLVLRTPKEMRDKAAESLISVLKQGFTNWQKRQAIAKKYPSSRAAKRVWKFRPTFKARRHWTCSVLDVPGKSLSLAKDGKGVDIYRLWDRHNPSKRSKASETQHTPWSKRDTKKKTAFVTRGVAFAKLDQRPTSEELQTYVKVQYWYGRFFLLVPATVRVQTRQQKQLVSADDIVALDPGIRKFLTAYSPQGKVEILGSNTRSVVDKQTRRIDRRKRRLHELQATVQQEKRRWRPRRLTRTQRKRFRRWLWKAHAKYYAAELKCNRVIRDLHYKASHYLLENYQTIIYPDFNAHTIAKHCKLTRQTKRRLGVLSFFKFRTRLLQTSTFYPGSEIRTGSEAYTSKQCGQCGRLHEKLGGSDMFQCFACGLSIDRDAHGARNILLKFLEPGVRAA